MQEPSPAPTLPSVLINGSVYQVAQPLSITGDFYDKLRFTEANVADIEATVEDVIQQISASADDVRDIVTNRLLPEIPYHSYTYESWLLRAAGTITAFNGKQVELKPCSNGKRCQSQYIVGFTDNVLMGWLRHDEWLVVVSNGIWSCTSPRQCILCMRCMYTCKTVNQLWVHKSNLEGSVEFPPPTEIQPFYNSFKAEDRESYRRDSLLDVCNTASLSRGGFHDIDKPIVAFNKDDYEWYVDPEDGVMRVDQSRLRCEPAVQNTAYRAGAAASADMGVFLPEIAQLWEQSGEEARPRRTPFALTATAATSSSFPSSSAHFFAGGRCRTDAALQPSAQLLRLCAPYFCADVRAMCFSNDFALCAENHTGLETVDPASDFGYTSWFECEGHLEKLAKQNRYVKLLVVRLLILGLLRDVSDQTLAYWLHLYIDQHMPFLAVVMHSTQITRDDIIEPCSITPVSDMNIPISAFLGNDVVLRTRAMSGGEMKNLTRLVLKFMPNTTTMWNKNLNFASFTDEEKELLIPIIQCVFLGNFRHAAYRPGILQRNHILRTPVEELLKVANNDPLVISKVFIECIIVVFERFGLQHTDDEILSRYMQQNIADCDWLLRTAVAQGRPVLRSDIRFASKAHEPLFSRVHGKLLEKTELENKVIEAAARSVYTDMYNKEVKLKAHYVVYAQTQNKTFVERLQMAGVSPAALDYCRSVVHKIKNQKRAYKIIAAGLQKKHPADALHMCKLYACLRHVQRADIVPVDAETYRRQLKVAQSNPAHRRFFYICLVCLTVDIPGVAGWRKEKRFYSDIEHGGRVYCPHCEGKPSVVKISLMGVRFHLMNKAYMLCTKCLEPGPFSSSSISTEGFFVCSRCFGKKKAEAIWGRVDLRCLRGRRL